MSQALRLQAHALAALECEAASLAARRARLLDALAEIDARIAALNDNGASRDALTRDVAALATLAMTEAGIAMRGDSDIDALTREEYDARTRAMAGEALRHIHAHAAARRCDMQVIE